MVLFAPRTPGGLGLAHLDKLVHAALFLALAATTRWRFGPAPVGLLAVGGYAAASELIQWQLLAQRTGDWRDAVADGVGAAAGWFLVRCRRRPPVSRAR